MTRIATLALLVASAGAATPRAHAQDCTAYVSAESTRALYDALTKGRDADGCELDDVHGERTRISVSWKRDEGALAPAVVVGNACAPPGATRGRAYSVTIPDALTAACPTATRGLRGVVVRETLGGTTSPDARPVAWETRALRIAATLAALVIVLALFALWRGRAR